MKKAHLSALLVISLLSMAAAVGCTSQGGQADAPVITLTFRHSWTLGHDRHMEEVLRDAVERFERTHPDVRVLLEGIDPAVHRQQLRREMVAGILRTYSRSTAAKSLFPMRQRDVCWI